MTYTVTLTAAKTRGGSVFVAATASETQDPNHRNNLTTAVVQVR